MKLLISLFFSLLLLTGVGAQQEASSSDNPAQQLSYPAPTLKNPRDTFRYFLKTMKGYKLGDKDALGLALKALDLSVFDVQTRQISGQTAAIKLVNTIDRLEYVDFKNIPTEVEGNEWTYKEQEVVLNNQTETVSITLIKNKKNKWLFSGETLNTIAIFERAVKNKKIAKGVTAYTSWREKLKNRMPDWTAKRSFVLLNGQWLALMALIFFGFISERILRIVLVGLIIRFLNKKGVAISDDLHRKLMLPFGIIIFTIFWSLGVRLLEFQDSILSWLLRGGQVVFTLGCVLACYQLVDYFCLYLEKKAAESENKFDDILVPLIRKSSKTFVVAVGVIAVGDSLTLDMKGLLAGMGIAGLGISLAAKDTISNLFGSLTVLLDRPFRIGDWVKIDGTVEGMVEEVGLRSCRIRTFHNSLITIPNGMLTNAHIDNLGLRQYRRFSTKISVQYDTPVEKIEAFCEAIRTIIKDSEFTRKDYFHVYLNEMNAYSLDILLYVFFETPDWSVELNERHRLLIDILKVGHEMGVEFAFPTQTLHMIDTQNPAYDGKPLPTSKDIDEYARELAKGVRAKDFGPSEPRSSV